jgi:hypothetical protein
VSVRKVLSTRVSSEEKMHLIVAYLTVTLVSQDM